MPPVLALNAKQFFIRLIIMKTNLL